MTPQRIAYLGDSALPGPALYLAGIMTHYQMPFIHVPICQAPPEAVFADEVGLYILSDYAAATFPEGALERLCARVRQGAGLLMLGGWESYHGLGGDYDTTPLAELLPVQIAHEDDRRNWPQLILVRKVAEHAILAELPFERPPGIGGYNAVRARAGARVILDGEPYAIQIEGGTAGAASFRPLERFPLLVVDEKEAGPAGAGRRACLTTDVAPHWVGGMVDWGERRLTIHIGEHFVEIGESYARLFRNLLAWSLGDEA